MVWESPSVRQRTFVTGIVVLALLTATLAAADLQPPTVAAFDRYVRATEAPTGGFLNATAAPMSSARRFR